MNLERIISAAVSDKKTDVIIDSLLISKGMNPLFGMGRRYTRMKDDPLAFCLGLSVPLSERNVLFGRVFISEQLTQLLSQEETQFVVAHELAHVVLNHVVISVMVHLGKEVLVELLGSALRLSRENARNAVGLAKLGLMVLTKKDRTIEEEITAQKELEADRYAVSLTRNKESAISCLKKLRTESPSGLSHVNQDGVFVFPALTLEQRIRAIKILQVTH